MIHPFQFMQIGKTNKVKEIIIKPRFAVIVMHSVEIQLIYEIAEKHGKQLLKTVSRLF